MSTLTENLLAAHEKACQLETQLIKHRASHRSLLAHLRMAAADLIKTKPLVANRYREVADSWEKYCAEPQESLGEVADSTPNGPAHEAGSRAVSEVAPQLESPQGIPVSHLSPGAIYAGEWDAVSK